MLGGMFIIAIACAIAIMSAVLTTRSANLLDARARLLDKREGALDERSRLLDERSRALGGGTIGVAVSVVPGELSAEELGAKFSEMLTAAKRDAGALS